MVHAKNYETVSTFVTVIQKKTVASFFSGHDVYYTDVVYMIQVKVLLR